MLNLKKGLALVLAAATALTFAPVANLGQAVDAQAALAVDNPISNLNIPVSAYKSGGLDNTSTPAYDGFSKIIPLEDGSGFWIEQAVVNASDNDTYRLFNASNGAKVYKHVAATDTIDIASINSDATAIHGEVTGSTSDLHTKALVPLGQTDPTEIAAASGKLTVDIWIPNSGTSTITFEDKSQATNKRYQTTTLTVTAAKYQGAGISGVIIKDTTVDATADNNTIATSAASTSGFFKDSGAETKKNNNEYVLSMNDVANGYILDATSITATEWNGIVATGAAVAKPNDDASQVLSINNIYTVTWSGTPKTSSVATSADTERWQLIPTGPTSESKAIALTASVTDFVDVPDSIGYTVDKSNNAIDEISFVPKYGKKITVDSNDGSTEKSNGDTAEVTLKNTTVAGADQTYTLSGLNKQVQNSGKLSVATESNSADVIYQSDNKNVLTVTDDGDINVVGVGTANIYVFVPETRNNKTMVAKVSVPVRSTAIDHIDWEATPDTALDVDNNIDLDSADQTATNRVLQATIIPKAASGLTVKMQSSDTKAFSFNANTGVITSNVVTSNTTGTITLTSPGDSKQNIAGTSKNVTVKVWTLPAADFDIDPIQVKVNESKNLTATVRTPDPYDIRWDQPASTEEYYTLSNAQQNGLRNNNTQTTSKLTAKGQVGKTSVLATIFGTSKTRPTTKRADVVIVSSEFQAAKKDADLSVSSEKEVNLAVGETAKIVATGAAVSAGITPSYTSDATSVATVSEDGTITAVKSGTAIVTVSTAANDSFNAGITYVRVNVTAPTEAPVAVTGVTVKNAKGAKVSVTWDSQDKNVQYRIYKKVGNGSWKAKNVTEGKSTLSVKKGATVTVKVKAFVKDANGKTTWGPKATKAKAFKTDKK